MSTLLKKLLEERADKQKRGEELLAVQEDVEARDGAEPVKGRALTDEERAEWKQIVADLQALDERLDEVETIHRSRKAAEEATKVQVRSEPLTYRRGLDDRSVSYFRDLALSQGWAVGGHYRISVEQAQERLQRHAQEMDVELPRRLEARERRAETELRGMGVLESPFEKRAANRTDGTGGYFVPPLWLIDLFIGYLRYGRPFVNSCRQIDLPTGTDSINIPKLSGGTSVAAQTADNASVSSTDITDTSVSSSVETLAGQEDVSIQLLEQSPGMIIDEVIMQDLIDAYNLAADVQALTGSGSSGQLTGIANLSGVNGVTYTSGSPTQTGLWTPLAQALSQLAQNRKRADGVTFWMHPRRWFWMAAGLDGNSRPLIVPNQGGFNAFGAPGDPAAEGFVGSTILGPPVYIDGSIGTALGSGTNQDEIFAVRGDDCVWFEGELRTRVLPEILSGTLGVRFQVYNYVAFLVRYAAAISTINGTGLVAPSGF